MCLLIKKKEIKKVAKKDMVCYKILRKVEIGEVFSSQQGFLYVNSSGTRYISPFMFVDMTDEVDNNEVVKANGEIIRYRVDRSISTRIPVSMDKIGAGLIHTIKTLQEAKRYANAMSGNGNRVTICECVIPKDTEYYEGVSIYGFEKGEEYPSYGSKQIRFVKEISMT